VSARRLRDGLTDEAFEQARRFIQQGKSGNAEVLDCFREPFLDERFFSRGQPLHSEIALTQQGGCGQYRRCAEFRHHRTHELVSALWRETPLQDPRRDMARPSGGSRLRRRHRRRCLRNSTHPKGIARRAGPAPCTSTVQMGDGFT